MDYNNSFLVPANAKRGNLIFNIFRPGDLILFCSGVAITLILLTIVPTSDTLILLLACSPGIISSILVLPIPNYHNTLEALRSINNYYSGRRSYYWKGWCIYEQFINEREKK